MFKKYLLLCVSFFLLHNSILPMRHMHRYTMPGSCPLPLDYSREDFIVDKNCAKKYPFPIAYGYQYNGKTVYSSESSLSQRQVKLMYEKDYQNNKELELKVAQECAAKVLDLKSYAAMRFFVTQFFTKVSALPAPPELKDLMIDFCIGSPRENNLKTKAGLVHFKLMSDSLFTNLLQKYDYLDRNKFLNSIVEPLTIIEANTNKKYWILDKNKELPVEIDGQLKDIEGYQVPLRLLYHKVQFYHQEEARQNNA